MDVRDISLTAEQARRVAEQVRAIDPEDNVLLADMIEGETDFALILTALESTDAEASMMADALRARKVTIGERQARYERRREAARAGIQTLLDAAGLRKWTLPEATISVSERENVKAQGDADPELLPDDCVKIERKPVMAAVKDAIAAGRNIPGYAIECVRSVTIRRK